MLLVQKSQKRTQRPPLHYAPDVPIKLFGKDPSSSAKIPLYDGPYVFASNSYPDLCSEPTYCHGTRQNPSKRPTIIVLRSQLKSFNKDPETEAPIEFLHEGYEEILLHHAFKAPVLQKGPLADLRKQYFLPRYLNMSKSTCLS